MNNYVDPSIYDEYYFRNWVVGAEEFKKGELHSFFKKSIELADIKSKDSILDIGFGRGEVIKYLIPYCKSIIGVDYAKAALKIAREIILETAVGPSKKVQDFESESFAPGVEHSQKVKATPAQTIMAQKIMLFCRIQLPFLG
jgi:cyclopropane fatty-acyl-phospholipid synthase-like methyltransferase